MKIPSQCKQSLNFLNAKHNFLSFPSDFLVKCDPDVFLLVSLSLFNGFAMPRGLIKPDVLAVVCVCCVIVFAKSIPRFPWLSGGCRKKKSRAVWLLNTLLLEETNYPWCSVYCSYLLESDIEFLRIWKVGRGGRFPCTSMYFWWTVPLRGPPHYWQQDVLYVVCVCVCVCGVGFVQRIDHMVGWGEGGVEFLPGLKWPPYSPSALQSAEP